MIVLPYLLVLWAEQHVSSVIVTVLFAATPLFVVLLPIDRPPHGALLTTVAGLGGLVFALGPSFSLYQAGGAVIALLAVVSTATSAVLARRELRAVNPLVTTALLSGTAAMLLFVASMAFERGQPSQWSHHAIGAILFLALIAGAPAYATYFWLLQQLEAYKVTTVQWIEPLVAIVETAFFLRVSLSFAMIAGSLVTLTSLSLVMRARADDDKNVSLLGI
jgi:drug/metabolite transporter (DMT)-like permease